MTENSQSTSTGGNNEALMGEYVKQRQHLKDLLNKKKKNQQQLAQLEQSILDIETRYLDSTTFGNIVAGFESYLKGSSSAAAQRKRGGPTDQNRVFSRSSISYNVLHPDNAEPSSATSTPAAAPTPLSTSFANNNSNHNNKDKDGGSNQPTPTSATDRKGGNGKKKQQQKRKDKEVDDEGSETDSREAKKMRTNFGASRK
ncbi:NuA4-domain-containing protein [Xylariaceae sp. FL0662B]|nr:NuA4-domain-containing protein [Xylariaceae sp. FL0662B]